MNQYPSDNNVVAFRSILENPPPFRPYSSRPDSTFALDVENLIANPTNSTLEESIEFILSAPPKKQMIVHGLITWDDVEPNTNSRADKLLQYVRRVRNNLFHGGKFNGGQWSSPERSDLLLRHSLVILNAAVEFVPNVREAYHG